jgi:class 3 adenylate cyclase
MLNCLSRPPRTIRAGFEGNCSDAREQRRLAAIVAADVVGYSRLMGRDESGTLLVPWPLTALVPAMAPRTARGLRSTGWAEQMKV